MAVQDDPVVVGGLTATAYRRLSPWRRFTASLPMRTALFGVALVWLFGCVWSFEEQTNFAAAKGFQLPWLLPLVIDGLAAAMAGVAYAASLDARPAIPARIATALAVAASATSNGAWAWERAGSDTGTVALAIGIPVAANLAFEVLLSELRRQIQRRRGQRAPVAIPYPRLIRLALSPFRTFVAWRRLVLEITDPRQEIADMDGGPGRSVAAATTVEQVAPPPSEIPSVKPASIQPASIEPASIEAAPSRSAAGSDDIDPPTTRMRAIRPAPSGPDRSRQARPSRPAAPRQAQAIESAAHRANGYDRRVVRVAELIRRGEDLTGDAVGELFGCSARTGRRLLAQGVELAERRNGDGARPRSADQTGGRDHAQGSQHHGESGGQPLVRNGEQSVERADERINDRSGEHAAEGNGAGAGTPTGQFPVVSRSNN